MQIVAVGMLSPEVTGHDLFFVQLGEDSVMLYDVFQDGRISPLWPKPEPMIMVSSSIEKFNTGYRLERPLPISAPEELPKHLGKFEILDDTTCRHVP